MTHYVVCAFCFGRGRYNVPAKRTVVTATGINSACHPCADEIDDARAAHWDLIAQRLEDA